MISLKLDHPVYTIGKKQLFSADAAITDDSMETLIAGIDEQPKKLNLFSYKTVQDDIFRFLNLPRYQIIFINKEMNENVLNLMKNVCLPRPVLESLYYFREYDPYTYRHHLIVFILSTLLAKDLLKERNDLIQEIIAGPTHDIGKICVPEDILKKSTPLTVTEQKILEHHSIAGYVLMCYYSQDSQNLAARVARDHHERRDGSGYPLGVRFNDRMIDIIAVSDIYDALISPRPYRPKSYDNRTALEAITEMAKNGKINLKVVQALVAHSRKSKPHYSECELSSERRGTPPKDNVYGNRVPDNADTSK